jgi:cell division protein FtsW
MQGKPKFDTLIGVTVLFLLIFGLIMITSIGVPKSIALSAPDVAYPDCSSEGVDCYLLFKNHLFRLFVGLIAFYIAYRLPIKFWKRVASVFFFGTIIVLLLVLIMGQSHGTIATNWLTIANTSLQPSEFAKLALVFYLAKWFTSHADSVEDLAEGFVPFCIISGAVALPIVLENDFGTVIVLALTAGVIYLLAGARLKHLVLGIFIAMMFSILVVATVSHVRERFQGFSKINEECIEDYCWQSQQANIAVGSGGFFGKGLTQGVQKSYWLPQASDDFIFAASAEELGFIRIVFIILAYLVIAVRGYTIAGKAESPFEMFVAAGITTWIVSQAFVNIAVNIAIMPVTGITLPFVSYGGSSLMACLIGIGILLNISKNTTYYANSFYRRRNGGARPPMHSRYRRA